VEGLYSLAQDFQTCSSVTWPKEGFDDLYQDDFINAVGWVLRQKLKWLETGPYQCALLSRGVTKKRDVKDEDQLVLNQAMEYARAVGTMLLALGARGHLLSGYGMSSEPTMNSHYTHWVNSSSPPVWTS